MALSVATLVRVAMGLYCNGVIAARFVHGGYRRTTNNRMELMAVIAALEALTKEGLHITIYSDSQYVVKAVCGRLAEELDRHGLQRWQKEQRLMDPFL